MLKKKTLGLGKLQYSFEMIIIFLIIHVKFPGWTKDKNQGFAILMSPSKRHKTGVEKTDRFEPLLW